MAVVIGAYLERLRDVKGVSQERIARNIGLRQTEVSAIERGDLVNFDAYDGALKTVGMRPAVFFKKVEEGVLELNRIARRDGLPDLEGVRAKALRGLARWLAEVNLPETIANG